MPPTQNTPDRWVGVTLHVSEGAMVKLLCGWSGGYLDADRWRLSSAVQRVIDHPQVYELQCESGSVYTCRKDKYGLTDLTRRLVAGWHARLPANALVVHTANPFTRPLRDLLQ